MVCFEADDSLRDQKGIQQESTGRYARVLSLRDGRITEYRPGTSSQVRGHVETVSEALNPSH